MSIPLSERELQRLENFVGYGNLDAPIWFLGMEEAGGGEERLRIRAKFDQVESLREAQSRLGYGFHFEGSKKIQSTWQWMVYTLLRLQGFERITADEKRNYQASLFGSRDGDCLIAELMPIPKPNLEVFDYPETFPHIRDSNTLYEMLLDGRIELYRSLLTAHTPKAVIAYGKRFWPHYDRLFAVEAWSGDETIRYGMSKGTLVIESPHLTSRAMNKRRDDFADLIRVHWPDLSLRQVSQPW